MHRGIKQLLVFLLLLGLLPFGHRVDAQGSERTVESERYVAFSTASEADTKKVLDRMEKVYPAYCEIFGFDVKKKFGEKFKVRLYGTQQEFLRASARSDAGGFYNTGKKELTSFFKEPDVYAVMAHEGMHQFHDLLFPDFGAAVNKGKIPIWYVEGVAEAIGNWELRGDQAWIGVADGPISKKWLHDVKPWVASDRTRPPLERLVNMSQRQFMANARINYGCAWSFAQFLFNYPDVEPETSGIPSGKYSGIIAELHEAFASGKSKEAVYAEVFKGDTALPKLEKEWIQYIAALPMPNQHIHYLGTGAQNAPGGGVQLKNVQPEGLLGKKGLEDGDVIVEIDNTEIKKMRDLKQATHRFEPGKKVKITVMRDGQKTSTSIKIPK